MPPVRARTLQHLDALVAALALTTACHAEAGENPAPTEPPTPPTPIDLGYSVVDELPPPAFCADLASSLQAGATTGGPPAAPTVVVHVGPQWNHDQGAVLDHAGAVAVTAATITKKQADNDGRSWVFELAPAGSAQLVTLTVHGTCEGKPAAARVDVRWEGALAPGAKFVVSIVPVVEPK